ncbi:arsenite efflux MFS transporter ArsK [Acidisoma cellulosilytica]|uniref:Arsenite efflux MFS transporter ArsK n=1 Tax=Acidisoma cellulosilyticum TaxID=2802395 RepID=A0A963Z3P6_9PROT|nr:arsenite efflux MFS transporter ArsK [Acidisoma cellulosilyticum]MCB8881891.1 arsenite efflux MFS transporter ArsK [Acidisoma cellulosilyticum]
MLPATGRLGRRDWLDIAVLGLSQVLGYGTLYYSFSTLVPAMARSFHWPRDWIFGALSLAFLAGGLASPWVGRWIDRVGAGRVMSIGSVAAAVSLAACALAPTGALFVPALIAMGLASTLVQYGAAFPLLVQRHPATARASIVYLTLIAGFSSTLFWPLTSWLDHMMTWRQVYFIFAGLNLFLCLPLHLFLCRRPSARPESAANPPARILASASGLLPPHARMRGFVLMAVAFSFQSFVGSAILVHMLPMLDALALGPAAVAVSALFGPAQVASRFINLVFGKDMPQLTLATISAALFPVALVALCLTAPSFAGAMLFAVLFGIGGGLNSIVAGTLPLALFGAEGYGARQGKIMSVRLVVGAIAPFAFAVMTDRIGITPTLLTMAVIELGAVAGFAMIARLV